MGEFGTFDFGLSAAEEDRARRLHAESVIVDMLYWGPVSYLSIPDWMEQDLLRAGFDQTLIEMETYRLLLQEAGPEGAIGFKQAWDDAGLTAGSRDCDLTNDRLVARSFGWNQRLFDTGGWLRKALTPDDIRRAKAEAGHAGWLNAQLIGGISLEALESYWELGLRMLMLTYNNMNHIGAGCTERTDAGVSNFGARFIKRMNELGVIVDTSHCGRQTTLDACALSDAPVIASHTCCEGLFAHARAKTDAELKRIAETGGIVGILGVPFFLAGGAGVTVEALLDHVDYTAQLIGWQHVGLGTDWPMMWPKSIVGRFFSRENLAAMGFRLEDNVEPTTNLIGFDDHRDLPNITRGLVKRGYSDEQVRGILGENFLRVFGDVLSGSTAESKERAGASV